MRLETERLEFRRYNDFDFEFLFSLMYDPEMVKYIGLGDTRTREETRNFLDWIYSAYKLDSDLGLMLLVNKRDGNLIGHSGLIPQTVEGKTELEIGCWISRRYWGNGYATEAGNALRAHGSKVLGSERFIALVHPENIASKKVATKLGMNMEKEILVGGQNAHMYSVSR